MTKARVCVGDFPEKAFFVRQRGDERAGSDTRYSLYETESVASAAPFFGETLVGEYVLARVLAVKRGEPVVREV